MISIFVKMFIILSVNIFIKLYIHSAIKGILLSTQRPGLISIYEYTESRVLPYF